MANDVEMNDVQKPLMKDSDIDNIPDVEFKSMKQETEIVKKDDEFRGLTKEELEKFAKDPFWMKLRLILFILFWIVWAAMLVAAILIVVFSKKCPTRPKLEFWQQKTGYWVDPYAYADTDQNFVGDFKGIMSKLDHIQKRVGAGYIILNPIFKGQYADQNQKTKFAHNFQNVDPILGSLESFKELVKDSRKKGVEIVLSVDLNSLSKKSINNADLNLRSDTMLTEIKESIKMWLNFGVRGFLLTNMGMYLGNGTNPTDLSFRKTCENESDFKPNFSNKFSTIDVQVFLKEIRKTMDEVAKSTDKSRLLIIDAGDIGLEDGKADPLLQYLGKKENLADMVIGREFLKYRGWEKKCNSDESSISNYLSTVPSDKRKMIGLTSTTLLSPRTNDLMKIVSPFLLEGNSILYYGSEVNMPCGIDLSSSSLYPANSSMSNKCNHFVMPWDNTGDEFSNGQMNQSQYISQYKNTVQSLTATGTGENILKLHAKLIKIRSEPSLLWGTTTLIRNQKTSNYSHNIFIRQANGFPIIVVALLKDRNTENIGKVFSFKSICEKFTPIVVYPSNENLEENKEVDTKNVFLKIGETGSVHVFKCAE